MGDPQERAAPPRATPPSDERNLGLNAAAPAADPRELCPDRVSPWTRGRSGRALTLGFVCACAGTVAGCGAGAHLREVARLPPPVELSVVIAGAAGPAGGAIRVSPGQVGAGQLLLDIANESSSAVALTVSRSTNATGGTVVARTGTIAARSGSQLKLQVMSGTYELATAAGVGAGDSSGAGAARRPSAVLHVGATRSGGNSALLEP